jgi:hypothetical protein
LVCEYVHLLFVERRVRLGLKIQSYFVDGDDEKDRLMVYRVVRGDVHGLYRDQKVLKGPVVDERMKVDVGQWDLLVVGEVLDVDEFRLMRGICVL